MRIADFGVYMKASSNTPRMCGRENINERHRVAAIGLFDNCSNVYSAPNARRTQCWSHDYFECQIIHFSNWWANAELCDAPKSTEPNYHLYGTCLTRPVCDNVLFLFSFSLPYAHNIGAFSEIYILLFAYTRQNRHTAHSISRSCSYFCSINKIVCMRHDDFHW